MVTSRSYRMPIRTRLHPDALAGEEVKARILEQLMITPVRTDELEAVGGLIEKLAPQDAPDDSFVRWLEVKSTVLGALDSDVSRLMRTASPMQKAALVQFADLDLERNLDQTELAGIRRELEDAAVVAEDVDDRDFLEKAVEELAL